MLAGAIRSIRRQLHNLADKSTWENFYASKQNNSKFDWFLDYQHLKAYLEPWIISNRHLHFAVLDLGCGISDVGAHIFLDLLNKNGKVDCVDFSETAIRMMQNKYQYLANNPRSKLSYICAEATSLPFTDCTYNMVLDKGTLDAAIRHQHGELIGQKIVAEALRVMACPSKLIQISDEDPDLRLQFLSNCCKIYDEKTKLYKTSVKFLELGTFNGIEYIMYTIEKGLSQPSPAT